MPPVRIESPTRIEAAGTPTKTIDEYIGRVQTGEREISIAHMQSPEGWSEPPQTPEFDEYTVVLRGMLRVIHDNGTMDICRGQGVVCRRGERVRYATPDPGGAEYIAVCVPAFSPDAVHRDEGESDYR